jgi:predicted TPR repeat methyltransferase
MRTATDFNQFYVVADPWRVSRSKFRNQVLRKRLAQFVAGRSVLELGCGEGHLTQTTFHAAKSITSIDISDIAIERAKARNLPNARFENDDFLRTSFKGFDIIAAIECIYYLSPTEQDIFFDKVANEHDDKILLLSAPITEENRYLTHEGLMQTFAARGFSLLEFRNLSVYWHSFTSRIIANLIKLPLGYLILDWLPASMIYQRLYVVRAPRKSLVRQSE